MCSDELSLSNGRINVFRIVVVTVLQFRVFSFSAYTIILSTRLRGPLARHEGRVQGQHRQVCDLYILEFALKSIKSVDLSILLISHRQHHGKPEGCCGSFLLSIGFALYSLWTMSKLRVVTFDSNYQTIHKFLDHWKPSLVTSIDVEWLTVSSGHASKEDELLDTSGLEAAWEALCLSSLDQLTTRDIERLTIAHNVLHGKWMNFATRHEVDTMWATIALAVVKGDLALDAKVSTAHVKPKNNGKPKEEKIPPGKHVICVWSQNFSNIDDVFALRGRLRDLGFSHPLMYKPDAYSICGVYQGNRLGLPANKFKS